MTYDNLPVCVIRHCGNAGTHTFGFSTVGLAIDLCEEDYIALTNDMGTWGSTKAENRRLAAKVKALQEMVESKNKEMAALAREAGFSQCECHGEWHRT